MSAPHIVVLGGDGIGPEVCRAGIEVLEAAATPHNLSFTTAELPIGYGAWEQQGESLTEETLDACRASDAVLLGAVGGPMTGGKTPELGLLRLRSGLGLYANLRPVRPHPALVEASPLKAEKLNGVDLLVVRELASGLYYGRREQTEERASDECVYTADEIARIARSAGEAARNRRNKVTSIDKANVLATSRLWRQVVTRVFAEEFPDVELEHNLVDSMAMHLLQRPADFDVLVTENTFGDILSDEASVLAGSLGLLPSASLGSPGPGLYEPVHGTAPDIAGKGIANPVGTIESCAMLARHSLAPKDNAWLTVADNIEEAVRRAFAGGARTADLALGREGLGTREFTACVVAELGNLVGSPGN